MSYRDEARRALESSAARNAQNQTLKQIAHQHPALKKFDTVDELLGLLRDPGADPEVKDGALLALLEEYQLNTDGGAFALLAMAMFPALDRLYRSRLRRLEEPDDLWGRVVGAFAEALDRYPTARRRARVAANIEGETMAAMRRSRLREVRAAIAQQRLTEATAPYLQDLEAVDPTVPERDRLGLGDFAAPGSEAAAVPDQAELQAAEEAVAPLFDAGAISTQDRFLILGVHLYQRTLGELAVDLRISREAAKKRHLRAMTRLRSARPDAGEGE